MSSVVVIGAQWGDEGKGKIVDYLAQKADAVVRYSGGSNAGHTVVVNDVSYKLRLLPSGVLYSDKTNVLGNGVVINPGVVLHEIADMKAKGISCDNLVISDRAHVVLPYHARLDELQEAALGCNKIGTTKGGIGPCYMDKVARTGIRICDLMEPDTFAEKLKINLEAKNAIITKIYGGEPFDYETMLQEFLAYAEELRPYIADTGVVLDEIFSEGKNVLFEGAQATFLDIDHGTYPYVTSRCGWLDAFMLKYSARLNSLDCLAVTRLDILDKMPKIKMCVGYKIDGQEIKQIPASLNVLAKVEPVFEEFEGWLTDITSIRTFDELPVQAKKLL